MRIVIALGIVCSCLQQMQLELDLENTLLPRLNPSGEWLHASVTQIWYIVNPNHNSLFVIQLFIPSRVLIINLVSPKYLKNTVTLKLTFFSS